MFPCCCPKSKNPDSQKTNIQQTLISDENSPTKIKNQPRKFTKSIDQENTRKISFNSQKSSPFSNLQMGRQSIKNDKIQINQTNDNQIIGVPPKFEQNNKGYLSMIKKKNKLFDMQHNTEIMFYDMKKQKEFCLRFVVYKKNAIQRQTLSSINFILSKVKTNLQKQSTFQHQLALIISSKTLYESKYIVIPKNIHAIFTNMRRSQQKKIGNQGAEVIQIVQGSFKHFRTASFDRIVIMVQNQKDFQVIKKYCSQITQKLTIQDYMKVWYIFPSFITLSQINQIIKDSLRKFLVNQSIQTISKYIFYQIDLIKQINLEPFIIVKNRRWRYTNKKSSTKQIQTQICLAVGLLMAEMNQNNVVFYRQLIQNTLSQTQFLQYLKLKHFLHAQRQNFIKKLVDLKILNQNSAKLVEGCRKIIQQKYEEEEYKSFIIKPSTKKKFVSAFGFQQSAQNSQHTPVRKEWDDNLRIQDIKMKKNSLQKQMTPSDDLNIIDDIEIDNTNVYDLQLRQQSEEDEKIDIQDIDDLDSDFSQK